MPLPKEYYDIDTPSLTGGGTSQARGGTALYPDLSGSLTSVGGGNAFDFVGSALWGATSGLTWGLSEFAVPSKPWEEMNTAEKSGWILGEGASLFAPWGPFGLMGRGSRLAVKGQNKFITEVSKTAAKSLREQAIAGTAHLTKKEAKHVLKAAAKGTQFTDDIAKGLENVARDDLGIRWLKDLGATGTAAINASDNLIATGTRAIMKSFDDAGIKGFLKEDAKRIATNWADDLAGGTYVNDVAEWVTRGLVNSGRIPMKAGGFMSNYLGMATQDLMMMGMHGLIAGKIQALARGQEFDTMGTLSHSAIMALGFPLIRKLPWGGKGSITAGFKAYRNSFKNTNYKAITKTHGEDVTRNLLRVMLNGSKKDLLSRSSLADRYWHVGGKPYNNMEEILKDLPTMKIEHVETLLNKVNKTVNQELIGKWGPDFITDLAQSVPRMAAGILVMNPWVVNKDAWGAMEGPELASHLFMSAVMTKGRGAWGHAEQRAHFADFTPYYEALHVLGVDVENVKDVLRFHDGRNAYEGMGAALNSNSTARAMMDIVDESLAGHKVDGRRRTASYENKDYDLVTNMGNLYNIMKRYGDPNHSLVDFLNLDTKTMNKIGKALRSVEFADKSTIGDHLYEGSLVKMTAEASAGGLAIYKRMLSVLAKEMGYNISVEGENVIGSLIRAREGTDFDAANTVNRILQGLDSINEATIRRGKAGDHTTVNFEKTARNWIKSEAEKGNRGMEEADFLRRTQEIIDSHMDELGVEYGDKNILRDPVGRAGEVNPMFEFFRQAKHVAAQERVYKIISNTHHKTDINQDSNLTIALDEMFLLSDNKYAASVDVYKSLIKDLIDKPKNDKEKEANQHILDNLNSLRYLFDLRKGMLDGTSRRDPKLKSEKKKLDAEMILEAKNKWQSIFGSLPQSFQNDWLNHTKKIYLERKYRSEGFDPRAVNLLSFMQDHRLLLPSKDGKITISSKESVINEMKSRKMDDESIAQMEEAFNTITQVLGSNIVREVDIAFAESGRRQTKEVDLGDYVRAAKLLGNDMFIDLLTKTQDQLSKLTTASEGQRQKIKTIYGKATDLINSLDPSSGKDPVSNPLDKLKEISKELNELLAVAKEDGERSKDIDEVINILSLIPQQIDAKTGKFNVARKQILTEEEQVSDDAHEVQKALLEPLQTRLKKIYEEELDGIDRLAQLVNKLENFAVSGKEGLGLSKSDTMGLMETLSRRWYADYKKEKGQGVKLLSELIDEVNQKGFFGDAIKVIEGINAELNRAVILNNEHHPFNQDGVRMAESLEKASKIHEHHKSVIEIAREYGLVNKEGKLDETFKKAIMQDPFAAIDKNIREKIFATDKPFHKKQSEWRKFRQYHAVEMLSNVFNSVPINKVSLMGQTEAGNRRGILIFENDSPHIQHPNNIYFDKKGYKVHWIEDTMSLESEVTGKLRNISLDRIPEPDLIQMYLNQALRVDQNADKILEGFKALDPGLNEKSIRKILENPSEYVFYARLSPMDKIMFVGTDKNMKLLEADFSKWYTDARGWFRGKNRTAFEKAFKHLLDEPNTSRSVVELKLLLPYLTGTGKKDMLKKMVKEIAGDVEGVASRPKVLAKIQADMFKRGFLSDGGTTQPMHPKVLEWISTKYPLLEIRREAKAVLDKGGFVIAGLSDKVSEDNKQHPLNISNIELGQLKLVGSGASDLVREIAEVQQRSLGDMKSLMNSLLDGGKFASERVMKLVMAQKGQLEDTGFAEGANGAKTIIFATGDNQMLGKGYLIYHPEIAAKMPADVDILLGDTSAKAYDGKNLDGTKMELFDVSTAGDQWANTLGNMSSKNKMLIPIEGLGVSFTSKNTSGVAISPSIFDFQSPGAIDKAIVWMDFESKIKQVGVEWNTVHKDGAKLANWLYKTELAAGNPLDKGDTGLSKLLFEYGAMPNNIVVYPALRRMLRGANYKHLSKAPNQQGGEDNFIVPNIDGKLSVPLYAELYKAVHTVVDPITGDATISTGDQLDRVSVRYGGIGVNRNTAGRAMGNGQGGNLEGESFAFRDDNGVDVLISINNNKFDVYSTYYDNIKKYDTREKETIDAKQYQKGVRWKGNKNDRDEYHDTTIADHKVSSESRTAAERMLESLSKVVNKWSLNFDEVFELLEGRTVVKQNTRGRQVNVKLPNYRAGLRMQLAVGAHAVPVVGHDKVVFRVEKILNNMNGLTEVNVHDLRTIMQRDNDGDHLYTHTRLPWEILTAFASENGRKNDFNMFNRDQVMNEQYINIFGFGKNGKANEKSEQVGFHSYANKLHNAKMMTGQVIGARNAISWLNRLGFQIGEVDQKGKVFKFSPLLKEIIDHPDMSSKAWKVLDKFYDTTQNALDIHGGIHEAISNHHKLRDFLFFGITDQYQGETGDINFDRHSKAEGFFEKPEFGKQIIEKEMFYEILRTLKKANMIQNDTWDEAGSRAPEPAELRSAYYDMRNFFSNPTEYLARRLSKRIQRERNVGTKNLMKAQYMKMFYGDAYDYTSPEKRRELYKAIVKGDLPDGEIKFKFSNVSEDAPETAFDKHVGAYVMKQMLSLNGAWDHNYEGISERTTDTFNAAGHFVRNIESFIETVRLFESDADFKSAIEDAGDVTIYSFGNTGITSNIKKALTNGILRELIHKEHRNVMGTLEFFRAEKYSNERKEDKLIQRLGNLQEAMNLMDVQIAKGMVIDRSDLQIQTLIKDRTIKFDKFGLKGKQRVAVYRIRGDVKVKEGKTTVRELESEDRQIDYGQLEFVGNFDSKSMPHVMKKGWTYIIDRKAKQMMSQSENENRYSMALFKVTYSNDHVPEQFLAESGASVSDFRDDVRRLRGLISMDYVKTVKNALSNRVLSDGIHALNRSKEGREIAEFLERWTSSVSGDDPHEVLFKYLIQPQIMPTFYYKDAAGREMPAYKTNNHLLKTVMQWALDNNHQGFVKKLIKDWEHYAAGRDAEIDITAWDRGALDKYDYEKLGDLADPVRSLARHLNIFYASPVLNDMLNKIIRRRRTPVVTVKNVEGESIPIRKSGPVKDSFWHNNPEAPGDPC